MFVLVSECLILNAGKVGRFVVFQLYHANRLVINQNGTIGLLRTHFVLQLRGEVVVG